MKKKKQHLRRRNAGQSSPRSSGPRPPRTPPPLGKPESSLGRLANTAIGAAGTAVVGALLARNGFHPKTAAGTLAAIGAGLAWKGDSPFVRSVGSGAMSAGGSQLALLMIDDHSEPKKVESADVKKSDDAKKPSNSDSLPPGALESAFERAKARLAYSDLS